MSLAWRASKSLPPAGSRADTMLVRAAIVFFALGLALPVSGEEPAGEGKLSLRAIWRAFFGVTISRETTHITGPLAEDGYVDYLAAVNEIAGRGVRKDDNAAVLLWQAVGPGDLWEEDRWREVRES